MKYLSLLLLFLTGCASTDISFRAYPKVARAEIKWVVVEDINAYCRTITGINAPVLNVIKGCATWTKDFKQCTIYTEKETTLSILGHEVRHCFEGKWH